LHSLKDVSETSVLKKMFSKAHKRTKVLETPLPKNITEKAQRIAAYVEDKKEVSKWEPTVKKNRKVCLNKIHKNKYSTEI
jgi:U3 small nucleolar RNA-associated protein 14